MAKNRSGGREGLFFTVNLVFCLKYSSTQNAESLPIAEGHDPTTSAVETSRNSQDIPIILSPHLLHSAAPCHALLPQQDTATSTGLSHQVPEGVFMHRDKQSPSHSEATGKKLQCQEECCNYMAQIGLRMKTLNLKWDDPIECRCV